ncbi:MAG: NAD(P)/FAD-dependent oxidoreductase [Brevefilum sp.]|nr:NAD(P)/FAD-dependent oxidoreductase [Brevefilum sp.]
MKDPKTTYDVAIIGSGIGGSTLAAILARQGQSVLVFEAGTHPKFAIGESTILETSEMMRALAKFYDVPELAYFSSENYFDYAGTTHGVKRHFGFIHHQPGQSPESANVLQAIIPKQPYGHELHLYRQDTDYYLTSVAIAYGAKVLQGTPVVAVDIQSEQVEITSKQGQTYQAKYVVDAGGFRSLLADQFDLRDFDLQTHTRGMFTHMIDVPCFNDVHLEKSEVGVPFRWSEGTLHHIFKGGWLWVIPFNNHLRATNPLCSVGLVLDPRVYPVRTDVTPEEEFYDFIEQFPQIRRQFEHAKPVRGWVRANRLQYGSTRVVGDRFALLGHSVGFIDPLYSKGLYLTHMAIFILADLLLQAKTTDDYSAQAFRLLEEVTLNYIKMHDVLVANSIKSWTNQKLWRVYSVQWLLGAYLEYLMLSITRMRAKDRQDFIQLLSNNRLAGGGFEGFFNLQEQVDAFFDDVDPEDELDVDQTVDKARALFIQFPWLPQPFQDVLNGKNHLPKHKFRLTLFNKNDGFMGSGAFRQHFFGNMTLFELAKKSVQDYFTYSRAHLRWQRKTQRKHLAWRNANHV